MDEQTPDIIGFITLAELGFVEGVKPLILNDNWIKAIENNSGLLDSLKEMTND